MSAEADEFIRAVMADMMDQQAAVPLCMSDELCLSIDLGTGGPKIGLVSLDGEVLDYELHSVETTYTTDGGATQDPTLWWTLICDSTRRLMARPGRHEGTRAGRRGHRPVRLDGAGRRQRRADRTMSDVARHAGTRVRTSRHRWTDSRATTRERCSPSFESPAADHLRRAPIQSARCST